MAFPTLLGALTHLYGVSYTARCTYTSDEFLSEGDWKFLQDEALGPAGDIMDGTRGLLMKGT